MSDQGFIDAILEDPGDIDRRLVYADYLEERGDPRAELIRLEHELSELTAASDHYWEIKPRRKAAIGHAPHPYRGSRFFHAAKGSKSYSPDKSSTAGP